MKLLTRLGIVAVTLMLLGWLGLRMRPTPFAAPTTAPGQIDTIALPDGLPAPVERYFRLIYGERVPVIHSAVLSGRASMRIGGIAFPARFRFTHDAGRGYRHDIELTFFGLPVASAHETFLEGRAILELPTGQFAGPKIDQGANLGLWAESTWLPAIWLTDPRVHWEAVDDTTAVLIVPAAGADERFVVRFDPAGRLRLMEAMRYRDAAGEKILWLAENRAWGHLNGYMLPTIGTATWLDQGQPWAVFEIENLAYNLDVR